MELAHTEQGRARLSRFCGESLADADWQRAFERAADHAVERKQAFQDQHHPGFDTRRAGESLADWQTRKERVWDEASRAVLAELEAVA